MLDQLFYSIPIAHVFWLGVLCGAVGLCVLLLIAAAISNDKPSKRLHRIMQDSGLKWIIEAGEGDRNWTMICAGGLYVQPMFAKVGISEYDCNKDSTISFKATETQVNKLRDLLLAFCGSV